MRAWLVAAIVAWCASAHAQGDVLQAMHADASTCAGVDTSPGASLEAVATSSEPGMPIPWTEFVVEGELTEPAATVHALFEPTLAQFRTSLKQKTFTELSAMTAKFGYQLVAHRFDGTKLVLHVAPLPIVRKVRVEVNQGWFDRPLDDEIRRRMLFRTGAPLPWEPFRRDCAMLEEAGRIEDYLHDEGYFDATAEVIPQLSGNGTTLFVDVHLYKDYELGTIKIVPGPNQLAIPDAEIRATFVHYTCIAGDYGCWLGRARFSRTKYQADLAKLKELFQKRGYPAARIQSSDIRTSFDRRTHKVNVQLVIDQRRHIDVEFVGIDNEAIKDAQLRGVLTFGVASSADDVEAANSARAIQDYLQRRGYFDARVTWIRERFDIFDKITFRVEPGKHRDVASVEFVGNKAIPTADLVGIVSVKPINFASDLLGTQTFATSGQLSADIDRIVQAYRRAGYRETRVAVSASPDASGLDDPAMTAALLSLDTNNDQVYVRYRIDEGRPTLLQRIELVHADKGKQLDPALCAAMMSELARELSMTIRQTGCTAEIGVPYREDDVLLTRDQLRDFLYKQGRPRAIVDYSPVPIGDHQIAARFAVRGLDELKIGRIIIRGNFKTDESVIRSELGQAKPEFKEGAPLTADSLAEAARKLRNTALFQAVNIELPDLGTDSSFVNALVRVEERYDNTAQVELSAGYSSYTHEFVGVSVGQNNIAGHGIGLNVSLTYGSLLQDYESTLRIPTWLLAHIVQADITARYIEQDTPRFGLLTTEGFSTAFTHLWSRQRTPKQEPDTKTLGVRYDFRLRSRNVDALRPIGADMDDTQVAVETRTSLIGIVGVWDHRLDRNGQLSPLSPEDGFRLEGSISYAEPKFLGQDQFFKISAAASKFFAIGRNLTLRGDFRYDQGIPLGGAALLPEVERFFAGGDTTVRGYEDDRLRTEIIQVGVPPVAGLSQIRIIPSGGNIRTLASIDAQLRLYKILAGAAFSDAGLITNQWGTVTVDDIRPSVGTGLRVLTPFGILAVEYAVPLRPHLGDDPRGRLHFYFAARAQF
ncbi:MAG: BamA/TamA family outer membrane protein [Deltaproteobacteria bacterium]|nr:BamA/TamA family outer membrane protein [Deltaproteobacteria bacterium]